MTSVAGSSVIARPFVIAEATVEIVMLKSIVVAAATGLGSADHDRVGRLLAFKGLADTLGPFIFLMLRHDIVFRYEIRTAAAFLGRNGFDDLLILVQAPCQVSPAIRAGMPIVSAPDLRIPFLERKEDNMAEKMVEPRTQETRSNEQRNNIPLDEPLPTAEDPGGAHAKGYSAAPGPEREVKEEGPIPLVPGHDSESAVRQPERDGKVHPTGRSEGGGYTPNDRLMGSDR